MKSRDKFNQKKYFDGKTVVETKICNHTVCDNNDFGKCLIEPDVHLYGPCYICNSASFNQMKLAEKEIYEQ